VATNDQRDRAVERLLSRRSGSAPAASACIDGETLAAWSERTLPAGRASLVEAHLADCADCQMMFAAFARTGSVAAAPVPLWTRWRLRWLVPLATAATAVAIWIAVPGSGEDVRPPLQEPAKPSAQGEAAPVAPSSADAAPVPGGASPLPQRDAEQFRVSEAKPEAEVMRDKPPEIASRDLGSGLLDAARDRREEAARASSPAAVVHPLEVEPPAPGVAAQSAARADRPQLPAEAEPGLSKAAHAPAAALPPVAALPPPGAPADRVQFGRQSGSLADAAMRAAWNSPDGGIRWRVTGSGLVERAGSADSGWERVELAAGLDIVTGAAPSGSVCWLVGRRGAVLRSTGNGSFERVAFREDVDLVAVTAADGRKATVTGSDGRTFATEDGGASWRAVGR
jgi:hypothetical protein